VSSTAVGGFVVVSSGGACTTSLARYDASGALDLTFGDAGKLCLDQAPAVDVGFDMEGRILLAGGGPGGTTTLVRLLPDGQADSTFGQAGVASLPGSYQGYMLATGGERIALYRSYLAAGYSLQSAITLLDDAGTVIREESVGSDLLVAGLALDTAGRSFVLGTLPGWLSWQDQLVVERLER